MKLNLGCGNKRIEGFTNIDILKSSEADLNCDILNLPFENESVDLIYVSSVLEHFGRNNKLTFFRNKSWIDALEYWHKLLKPSGELFISVPNFEAICQYYLKNKNIEEIVGLTLGGQKNDEDLHGMIFDFSKVKKEMLSVGFSKIEKYEWSEFAAFKQEGYDDYSAAYLPHMDFENGTHMMLNVKGVK